MNTTSAKKQPPVSALRAVSDEPPKPHEGRPLKIKDGTDPEPQIHVRKLNLWYNEGKTHALKDNSIDIFQHHVTAFIGPSGCGKSTFLRCLNRMNDLINGVIIDGLVEMDGRDVYHPTMDEVALRQRVGMVFQKPNPFPKSVYENIAYAPRMHDLVSKNSKAERELVEQSLIKAGLWDEVKDFLDSPGTSLSGGQQQRLCIARAIAVKPDVILMDEPTSALDPLSTKKVEDLIQELKHDFTIVIVTHNMQQAERIADYTAFFYLGELVEYSETNALFNEPTTERARQYISGDYG